MNTKTTGDTQTANHSATETAKHKEAKIMVVDIGKKQSRKQIKRLRNGKGKLFAKVDRLIQDLTAKEAIDESAQPIVIVVRRKQKLWLF